MKNDDDGFEGCCEDTEELDVCGATFFYPLIVSDNKPDLFSVASVFLFEFNPLN